MNRKNLLKTLTLLASLLCSLSTVAQEAYAEYTSDNTTLTFYYDNLRSTREGTTYGTDMTSQGPRWINYLGGPSRSVTCVVFDPTFADARPTSTERWFYEMYKLQSIVNLNYLNTSQVTDMREMFRDCRVLTSLDLSNFNTANVTDMRSMFNNSYALTSLDLSNFNTVNVTNMSFMFSDCSALSSLNMSSFNTANVTDMAYMFYRCTGLTSLDVSSFDTHNVVDMNSTFKECDNLVTIYAGSEWTTAAVTNTAYTFAGCYELVGGQGTTYSSGRDSAIYAHIDGGPSNPGYFTDINAIPEPEPYACYTPSNTTLTFYYDNQRSTRTGTTYDLNTGENAPDWIGVLSGVNANVTHVVFDPSFADVRPTSTYSWFLTMTKLETITGMEYLNTSAVTNMFMMFNGCNKLSSLDVSHFNTSKVTNMVGMFMGCSTLTSLDVTNFDTYKVTSDLGMYAMFENCSGLTSLDLSSFNTSRVKNMREMFKGCNNLVTIYVGESWSTSAVTNSTDMFANCTSLVGGMGTTFDSNQVDAAYAHIDGGPSNPGYFTDINAPTEPEAYACYTPSNTTLTFYYDNQRSTREGTTYDLNEGTNQPVWYTDGTYSSVTRAVFDPSFADARPTSTRNWFYSMRILESITGLGYLNTSEVTNMDYMFTFCRALTSLDVSNFNTANVTTMSSMFNECVALTSLDVSNFNTANVTNMANLFYACSGLTTLDLGNWNTAKVTNPSWMFGNCSALKTIYVGNEWSTDAVTFSNGMFSYCTSLVGGAGTAYSASNPVDKTYAHIDGGPSNPGYFTAAGAQPWTEPEAYACYTPSNTTLTFYHDNQRNTREGTTYDLNEGMNDPCWDIDGSYTSVTRVVFDPSFADARPTSMCSWFWGMTNLQSIDGMDCVNTEDVTTMWGMFANCSSLTTLDLSRFNTGNVINALNMFNGCTNLTTIYGGDGWNTSSMSVSSNMFTGCFNLVGGKGTTYDANHTNKYYARIDGGPSNPGYFTEKVDFVCGDVNGDSKVTISDVTALIDLLLSGGVISNPAADCNQDGEVKINDVTALIDYLLSGSW